MNQLNYEELGKLIEKMTPEQKKYPVKMYTGTDGELHPQDISAHPDHGFSSRLILLSEIQEYVCCDPEYTNPNQYIIEEYMDEEGSKDCQKLHYRTKLLESTLTPEQREYMKERLTELHDWEWLNENEI
jgi:hypothetical protein